MLRWFRKLFRVTDDYEGQKFFVFRNGIRLCHAAGCRAGR